jgi:hypothetical protein
MCYVFDEEVGQTKEMLLISLAAIIESKINILYHMNESNKNERMQHLGQNKEFFGKPSPNHQDTYFLVRIRK